MRRAILTILILASGLFAQDTLTVHPTDFVLDTGLSVTNGTLRLYPSSPLKFAVFSSLLQSGTYDVTVTASAVIGVEGFPNIQIRYSRTGAVQSTVILNTTAEIEYKTVLVVTSSNPSIYVTMSNAPIGDTGNSRARIRSVTLIKRPIVPQPNPTMRVRVSWNPNIESDLAGYRVYYGENQSDYSTVTTPDTMKLIDGIAYGKTYYFSVSAFDLSGNESQRSEEVTFFEPPPTINPRIQIVYPDSGQVISGNIIYFRYEITGDTSFVKAQEIYLNGSLIGRADNNFFPVVGEWEVSESGKYTLTIKLYDMEGITLHEKSVAFFVSLPDTTPPETPKNVNVERIQ